MAWVQNSSPKPFWVQQKFWSKNFLGPKNPATHSPPLCKYIQSLGTKHFWVITAGQMLPGQVLPGYIVKDGGGGGGGDGGGGGGGGGSCGGVPIQFCVKQNLCYVRSG